MSNVRLRALRSALILMVAALGLSGCISMKSYVDPGLPVIAKEHIVSPQNKQPVQVLFEFRSKGKPNSAATSQMRPRVVAVAAESGMFSNISSDAQPNGAILKFVIDNVPVTKDAAAKGFGTGLTFGLVGSMVTDGYEATATYTQNGKSTDVTLKHALHSTVGNKAGPPGLTPMTPMDAVNTVVDQLTWNMLKQLSEKGAFQP